MPANIRSITFTVKRHDTSPGRNTNAPKSGPVTHARRKRIIVAVTGATGAPLAVVLLEQLRKLNIETHLIVSKWGAATLKYELSEPKNTLKYLHSLADHVYSPQDVSASLSSGSFRTNGMIVVPCSMKTLAAIRIGYDNDLVSRAAGVTLKERRRLVLVARETPLSMIHLENMLEVTRAGALVFPPVMAFYTRPDTVLDMVQQSVRRMVDALDLGSELEADDDGLTWEGFDWSNKVLEKERTKTAVSAPALIR
jgi:phenylacrylic acid decarboxylase